MANVKPDLVIYKILTPAQWDSFHEAGQFSGSPHDLADGFIHFSRANQLQGTLETHYTAADTIILLEVATEGLIEGLKWEESRNGDLFPHLYANFSEADVHQSWEIKKQNGVWSLPI